jgi:phosphoglycerate kinase
MEKELRFLGGAMAHPERPLVAILGGAKISGKIELLERFLETADHVIVGGAMACTFFLARGLEVGGSLVEPDRVEMAKGLLARARETGRSLHLPLDGVVAKGIDHPETAKTASIDAIEPGWSFLDVGPASAEAFREVLADAKTVLWNGPMGVFEKEAFAEGTRAVARMLAEATAKGASTIVGGGDSARAIREAGLADRVTHLSTGGGASLELLAGRTLPGVAALSDAARQGVDS